VHEVELSGFWIGKTEVTVGQWRSVMGGAPQTVTSGARQTEVNRGGDDHPVVGISWNDCRQFAEKTGLALPTEAQWEYAARGPDSCVYPWGDAWDTGRLCWGGNPGPGGGPHPVGSFPDGASWCGALEMAGNVWEWCADWYSAGYYANSPPRDPAGPTSGEWRVLRGGGWLDYPRNCRSANRESYFTPDHAEPDLGLRVIGTCP
jgi:formylglycine-generating enzyme required for sulfatase activity